MFFESQSVVIENRPDVSVYWRPGCSSCLKVKEFVEELGIDFESVNVFADAKAMDEITQAGLRSIPAVRSGSRFVYAQSLEDVASLLGVSRNHNRLPNEALFARWDEILVRARSIVAKFDEEQLAARVIPMRDRSVKQLSVHIFQIVEAFLRQFEEGLTEIKPVHGHVDPSIVTRHDLLAFIEGRHLKLRTWLAAGRQLAIPERIATHYGEQPSAQVVERAVWHCAQHARQLDIVAAGRLGAEIEIPLDIYAGLPLPKRLWM